MKKKIQYVIYEGTVQEPLEGDLEIDMHQVSREMGLHNAQIEAQQAETIRRQHAHSDLDEFGGAWEPDVPTDVNRNRVSSFEANGGHEMVFFGIVVTVMVLIGIGIYLYLSHQPI